MTVTLTVPGTPKPKGSLKPVRNGRRIQLIEDAGPAQTTWRQRVAYAAKTANHPFTIGEPVAVEVWFYLPRPASHHMSSRPDRPLRDDAPEFPVTRSTGDGDKLFRLIGDALVDGGLLPDDSQIVDHTARKRYAPPDGNPGAYIYVTSLQPPTP